MLDKILIINKECVEASWVKNEWRRFLHLSQADPQKVLIPCYIGDDFYDIFPNELLSIQGSAMWAMLPVLESRLRLPIAGIPARACRLPAKG